MALSESKQWNSRALKVSSKLGRRERRYMFGKRVNKMISGELAKQIQIEIDNQIVRILQSMAAIQPVKQ
jgi:hypothetical protein